jgi:hypothetical protein
MEEFEIRKMHEGLSPARGKIKQEGRAEKANADPAAAILGIKGIVAEGTASTLPEYRL